MVVIGGKHSANSIHLAQICREYCDNVQFIERTDELDISRLRHADRVGLTAGASTPAWIIKEVRNKMSDEIKIEESAAEKEMSFVKVGDTVEAVVVRVNDVEGVATLSKKRLDAAKVWNEVEAAVEDGTVLEGVVTEDNKGGVVVSVKGVRVFVPASQTDLPRDASMAELLKKTVSLKDIVDTDLIISSRHSREEEIRSWFESTGKEPRFTVKTAHSSNASKLVDQNIGIAIFPATVAKNIPADSNVVVKKIVPDVGVDYILSWDKEKMPSALASKFIDHVRNLYQNS